MFSQTTNTFSSANKPEFSKSISSKINLFLKKQTIIFHQAKYEMYISILAVRKYSQNNSIAAVLPSALEMCYLDVYIATGDHSTMAMC